MSRSTFLPLQGGGERRAKRGPGGGGSLAPHGDHPHPPRQKARVASPLQGEERA